MAGRLWIRCEATRNIGVGHVMRCKSLAEACAAKGWQTTFLTNAEAAEIVPALQSGGHRVMSGDDKHLTDIVAGDGAPSSDVILWDGYRFDASDHSPVRDLGFTTMVIDDLASRPFDCDLLLDQTLGRTADDYRPLVGSQTELLLGPEYALLRPEFAAHRHTPPLPLSHRRPIIFVNFGGTDFGGLTARATRAFLQEDVTLIAVLGAGAPASSVEDVNALKDQNPDLEVFVDPPDFTALLASSDLAVGAAGTSVWERCALGIPSLLAVLADNQALIAKSMVETGAALFLDTSSDIAMRRSLRGALDSPSTLASMAARSAAICDGQGARRVADILSALP